MSINVVTFCSVHGRDVEIFTIGKKNYCATCVSEFLAAHCSQIKMVTIEEDPPESVKSGKV